MRQPIFFARFCICEIFGPAGYPRTTYTYSPFGEVSASGDVTQPIQWSSEVWDSELGLVYYNWRYYNSVISKWTKRDNLHEIKDTNLYRFCSNAAILLYDNLGLAYLKNNKTGKDRYKLILSDSMYIKRKDNIKAEAVTYNIFPKKINYPKYNKHNSCYDLIFPEVMHIPQVEFSENGLNMHKEIRNGLRKTALSHEEFHVDIGIKHWNNFVDDTKLLEGKYLNKKCAFQALTIVQKKLSLHQQYSTLENYSFDKEDAAARNMQDYVLIYNDYIKYYESDINYKKNEINQILKLAQKSNCIELAHLYNSL